MSKIEDGGPAFPVHGGQPDDDPRNRILAGGMSLRDWFAGHALAGLLANPHMTGNPLKYAATALSYADAMLAVRNKDQAND